MRVFPSAPQRREGRQPLQAPQKNEDRKRAGKDEPGGEGAGLAIARLLLPVGELRFGGLQRAVPGQLDGGPQVRFAGKSGQGFHRRPARCRVDVRRQDARDLPERPLDVRYARGARQSLNGQGRPDGGDAAAAFLHASNELGNRHPPQVIVDGDALGLDVHAGVGDARSGRELLLQPGCAREVRYSGDGQIDPRVEPRGRTRGGAGPRRFGRRRFIVRGRGDVKRFPARGRARSPGVLGREGDGLNLRQGGRPESP